MFELGALLRAVRKSAGLKQSSVSGIANQGTRYIGDVENGKPTVQAQKLLDLVGWLELEIVIRRKRIDCTLEFQAGEQSEPIARH
jgi:HTH-type transcriptional regulator/antitoxin HipB